MTKSPAGWLPRNRDHRYRVCDYLTVITTCTTHTLVSLATSYIFRSPDIVVGGLRFYRDSSSFFFCLFSSPTLRACWKEINQNHPRARNLETHVRNLGIPPNKSGAPEPFFLQLRNLTANLQVYILGTKRVIDNRKSALATRGGLLHRLKKHELWSTNTLKLDVHFYRPSVNSAFHFIVRLHARRPANGTHHRHFWKTGIQVCRPSVLLYRRLDGMKYGGIKVSKCTDHCNIPRQGFTTWPGY